MMTMSIIANGNFTLIFTHCSQWLGFEAHEPPGHCIDQPSLAAKVTSAALLRIC